MYLVKRKDGSHIPSSDPDYEDSKKIKVGDEIKALKARNPSFHRKAFSLLNIGFENQEKYESFEVYRKVMTILAGYFDWVPTKDGDRIPMAHSLSYENMSAEKFEKWYDDMIKVVANDLKITVEELDPQLV